MVSVVLMVVVVFDDDVGGGGGWGWWLCSIVVVEVVVVMLVLMVVLSGGSGGSGCWWCVWLISALVGVGVCAIAVFGVIYLVAGLRLLTVFQDIEHIQVPYRLVLPMKRHTYKQSFLRHMYYRRISTATTRIETNQTKPNQTNSRLFQVPGSVSVDVPLPVKQRKKPSQGIGVIFVRHGLQNIRHLAADNLARHVRKPVDPPARRRAGAGVQEKGGGERVSGIATSAWKIKHGELKTRTPR